MGIGMGKMLGFDFPANFNYPYISASITEFWRRWHMTLSGWFREYVYIPLGGNRKGLKRQIMNLFIVELLTGIWHGANWNFICWGLYYFVLLAIEKLFLLPHLKKGKVWPHIYTLFLVVVGWAMFVGNDTGVSFGLLFQKLFIPSGGVSPLYFLRNYGVLLIVSVIPTDRKDLEHPAAQCHHPLRHHPVAAGGLHCLCGGQHQQPVPVLQLLREV